MLEISQAVGGICTTEIGKCYKAGLFFPFLESQPVNIYQHVTDFVMLILLPLA